MSKRADSMRSGLKALSLLAALLVLAAPGRAAEAGSSVVRTLDDAYAKALAASETIAINEQSIRQAEALYRRAFGGSFPEISLRSVTAWQDGDGGRSQTDGMVRLSQSSLTGYRELMAARAAKATTAQREAELQRAQQLLLVDVAGAFFGLRQSSENVKVTLQLEEFAGLRLKELKERTRVGRGREADAIAQEVQLAGLESQLEEGRRQVEARKDLLSYLTRAPEIEAGVSAEPAKAEPPPLESYLARLETRPDVVSARKAAEAASDGVGVARADRLPQIGLLADWFAGGLRPDSRNDLRWDGQLTVSLPVWSWGARKAGTDAAKAFWRAEELALQSARRQAALDIKNAYRDYASAKRQLEVQGRAVALAQRDFELQRRDEKRGLITSIEVLQSLDRLNSAELARINALLQTRLAAIALELSAGARPGDMDLR